MNYLENEPRFIYPDNVVTWEQRVQYLLEEIVLNQRIALTPVDIGDGGPE